MALGPQALTTVPALRAQLAGGATDDTTGRLAEASLAALIERASAAIEGYCDRVLLAPTDDQTYHLDGNGEQRLVLPEWPIAALTSLRIDGEDIAPRGDGPSGYVAREAEGWLDLRGHTFTVGLGNIEVVGRLGYDPVLALSERRHRRALADLEAACLLL
ncbi:MAG: hypothetical protein HUU35_18150, partial [Armatimonadetes bacterium]|nr:hypothetical protein [Armatimonadota bacterium]